MCCIPKSREKRKVAIVTKRWKITVEYDGTDFCGWQTQPDGIVTVQALIEEAIYKFCQQNIRLKVAGRTDAGVHATGQVAHFDLDYGERQIDGFGIAKALNAHLRHYPICILKAEHVADDFHARFDATNKLYIYRVINRRAFPAIDNNKAWHIKTPLDVDAMRDAATVLLGTHDFTSFRATACQAKSPIRSLDRLDITTRPYDLHGGVEIKFHLEAQSFLHHQVRNMVGSLTLIGHGKWTKEEMKTALEAKDRTQTGPKIPAHGLYLVRIDYPEHSPK
jgi:tRNA pseudouridine38-40 synthase